LQRLCTWKVLALTRNWGLPSVVSLMAKKLSSLTAPVRSQRKSCEGHWVEEGDQEPRGPCVPCSSPLPQVGPVARSLTPVLPSPSNILYRDPATEAGSYHSYLCLPHGAGKQQGKEPARPAYHCAALMASPALPTSVSSPCCEHYRLSMHGLQDTERPSKIRAGAGRVPICAEMSPYLMFAPKES
jgi:hypothetical protein